MNSETITTDQNKQAEIVLKEKINSMLEFFDNVCCKNPYCKLFNEFGMTYQLANTKDIENEKCYSCKEKTLVIYEEIEETIQTDGLNYSAQIKQMPRADLKDMILRIHKKRINKAQKKYCKLWAHQRGIILKSIGITEKIRIKTLVDLKFESYDMNLKGIIARQLLDMETS